MNKGEELFGTVYEKGEVVFRRGDRADTMFMIILEAPRGLMVHSYLVNKGCIEKMRLLVATHQEGIGHLRNLHDLAWDGGRDFSTQGSSDRS